MINGELIVDNLLMAERMPNMKIETEQTEQTGQLRFA